MSEELSRDMVSVNREAWENCMDALNKQKAEIEKLNAVISSYNRLNDEKNTEILSRDAEIERLKAENAELLKFLETGHYKYMGEAEKLLARLERAREASR